METGLGRQVVAGVISAEANSIHNPESGTQKGVSAPSMGICKWKLAAHWGQLADVIPDPKSKLLFCQKMPTTFQPA